MKPYVRQVEDGSILFEWISKNHRFCISIEPNIVESSWFFVSKDGTMESGYLPSELIQYFKRGVNV